MSANTGFKPDCTNGHNDVDQHIAGIIASSPLLNFFFLNGLHDANTDNKLAEEPELTITAYFEPIYLANSNSNLLVIFDIVKHRYLQTHGLDLREIEHSTGERGMAHYILQFIAAQHIAPGTVHYRYSENYNFPSTN